MEPKRTVGWWAKQQWTIVRADQLELTRGQLRTLEDNGHLHRRHRGIYSYGTDRPPAKGVLLAAQWSCARDAYLTGRTALALAGVRGLYLGRIEIAVPRRIRPRAKPLVVQVSDAPADEVRRQDALAFATTGRALLDLAAAGATVKELNRLITDAIHANRLNHKAMAKLAPGHPTLEEAYRFYLPRPEAKSGLERSFDAGLATRPQIPDPQRNITLTAGGIDWEIDRYWADTRVAVELQGGPYHDAEPDRAKDELKAAKLLQIGVLLYTITDTRWELEPGACLDDLEAIRASSQNLDAA